MESLSESSQLSALYRYALDSSIAIRSTVLRDLDLSSTAFTRLAALLSNNSLLR